MRYFRDTGILFLGGILSLCTFDLNRGLILAMLETVILICGSYFFDRKYTKTLLWSIFIISFLTVPETRLFCPVLIYILTREQKPVTIFSGGFLGILILVKNGMYMPMMPIVLLLCEVMAWILATDAEKYDKMYFEIKRIKDDSEERTMLLAEKNKALQEKQNYEIYAATLHERNRIAREIHDNVGHLLSRTILLTGAAKTVNQDKNMESLLEGLDTSLNSAMNSIRSSVHNLHDESETLREIIKGIIKDFEKCTMEYDMSEIIPNEIKYCFAAIIKEALSNVIKHSNATTVKIVLREHPALYQLCIEDNGSGYSTKEADSKGIGLKNMQERVIALGGTLQINGENGFRIFAVIPKQQD